MAATPQGGALSSLNMAIDALNLAKEVSNVTPAKVIFSSVSVLLAMVKVRSRFFYNTIHRVHMSPGLNGQRTGLRRDRVILCRHLQSPRPGDEWETIG
jgi:hypothetical protein